MSRHTLLLQLSVEPVSGLHTASRYAGAFANVWVLAEHEEAALVRAAAELSQAGWRITSQEEPARKVTLEDFAIGSEARELLEQCQVDQVVIQLHAWRENH